MTVLDWLALVLVGCILLPFAWEYVAPSLWLASVWARQWWRDGRP